MRSGSNEANMQKPRESSPSYLKIQDTLENSSALQTSACDYCEQFYMQMILETNHIGRARTLANKHAKLHANTFAADAIR